MKSYNYNYIIFFIATLFGCKNELQNDYIHQSIDITRVLDYYKNIEHDTLKYAAAIFLTDNMPLQFSTARFASSCDTLELWRKQTDSIYYSLVIKLNQNQITEDSISRAINSHRNASEECTLPDVQVDYQILCDKDELSFDFLKDHIENAFNAWKTSPFAKKLSFEEFKEFILPYRSIPNYGFNETGKTYREIFGKYLTVENSTNLSEVISLYNKTINNLRNMNGKTHRKQLAGLYDLYSRDFHDCVDVANYGCNILRSCGVPVVVEYNTCYRSLPGRHYHCSVYDTENQTWKSFNAESSLPNDDDWAFSETANVYRITFGPQTDTPPFLKANDEYVPRILNKSCMKDVTSYLTKTVSVTLDFKEITDGNLAYLATFNKASGGVLPVTWGVIDKIAGIVSFQNVQPNLLYFPIYYKGESQKCFGQPFMIALHENSWFIKKIPSSTKNTDSIYQSVILTRKYPQKESMACIAKKLIGGAFIASNKADFSIADTLLKIIDIPKPYFETYQLNQKGKYQYYRFQAPDESPHSNISMLEWLTLDSYGYTNTMNPYRSHILSPSETMSISRESSLMRLMDEDSWDKMSWKSEYDGNMQTAPSAYPNITLRLKEPQIVTHVRFSPQNADNGIHAGDVYELYYWDSCWVSLGRTTAKYEYVEFKKIPKGRLYWLENKSRGKEEMPFVLDQLGRQQFIYEEQSI